MKIWHISDTHGYHHLLEVPQNIDVVVFSGDCANVRDPYLNENEVRRFLEWFSELPIRHKVMIAGNHDTSLEKRLITKKQIINDYGITYLENDFVVIDGKVFYGSPYTPTFGDWAFMRARDKINKVWTGIPDDTDILITHGPGKGILDLSDNYTNDLHLCGDGALLKRILKLSNLKLHMFGHIHNFKDYTNAGVLKLSKSETLFSNGSVVTDGRFGTLSSNGNILEV